MRKLILIVALCLFAVGIAFGQGKYVKDGQTFVVNDKFRQQFAEFIYNQPQEVQIHLADIWKTLERGETVTYNSITNELSSNVYFSTLSARQNRKMQKKGGTYWDAFVNGGKQNAHLAIYSLRSFNPTR